MSQPSFKLITPTESELEAFLKRVRACVTPEDYQMIEGMSHALPKLMTLIEQHPMTMRKLQHMIFGPKTEKTDQICPPVTVTAPVPATHKPKRKGHGRIKASDYTGARWVDIAHPRLKTGDPCPCCSKGTVRAQKSKSRILQIVGAAPISATGYELDQLRCDTCGHMHTAPPPPQAGTQKYAPSVGVTVALLRYGFGMPHYRLAKLQKNFGVPLPEATQWELMNQPCEQSQPIFDYLISQAANSHLVHNDDTNMRILDLRRPGSASAAGIDPKRKGTFTTNILAEVDSHPVALFFTGWQHAGENLRDLLRRRSLELNPPIQMCDALSRNISPDFETLLAHCLSHGRREFVTVSPSFPAECQHVLKLISDVYGVDAQARERQMTPDQRLAHHQSHSQPVMKGVASARVRNTTESLR